MAPGYWLIKARRGSRLYKTLTVSVNAVLLNLTGYSARLMVRDREDSANLPLVSLTSAANGGIVLGGAAGTIVIDVKAPVTALWTFSRAVYDLELVPATGEDDAYALLRGHIDVDLEATRV